MTANEPNLEGRVLAQKYELVRRIGQGAMGAVYEARNHLGKRFAVKLLLKAEFAQDPQLAGRFFREAQASAAIESEHIVQVYDTGVDPDSRLPFILMELLKGEDLEHTIDRVGALQPVSAARIISQAAIGLSKAHAAGIVHRDIKPANIFMSVRDTGDAVVKILDFGIAKASNDVLGNSEGQGLTKTGSMLGTPLYMSPEQAQGAKYIDARSDVWSLSMCLYEALTGRTPWGDADTLGALILAICSRDVPPVQDAAPWVPPELARVVHAGLTRDVNQRIQSAQQLVEMLRPLTGGSLAVTPEHVVGVAEHERGSVQPRAASVQQSVAGVTSPGSVSSGKKGGSGAIVGLVLVGVVLLGGAAFAVQHFLVGKSKEDAKTESVASTTSTPPPSATSTAPATTTATSEPESDTKSATLTVKIPKSASLRVGKDDWTSKVTDGKLTLTGEEGQQFLVSVWQGKQNLLTQKVYMGDGFLVPDEIDTTKGEQLVKPPPKGAKSNGAPDGAATKKGDAPTTKPSAPSTVSTAFE